MVGVLEVVQKLEHIQENQYVRAGDNTQEVIV